jgi:hypothetical protein
MSTAAPAFKLALYNACVGLYPSALVTYGHPGAQSVDDMVGVMNVTSDQEVGPLSPQRRREETLTVEVIFSCWRGGADQRTVTEAAYALLASLENYLQDTGVSASTQITLGGTVRDARVMGHELAETEDPADMALGRLAEITATVTARARI